MLAEQPPALVTVKLSVIVPVVPAVNVIACVLVALVIVPLVIDQAYVDMPAGPLAAFPVEFVVTPVGAVMAGAARLALTVTLVVPAAELQLPTVTMTEYVPLLAVVALAIVGFCNVELKLFGPVQA